MKKTANTSLVFRRIPLEHMVVVCWTDSSLFGNRGEEVDELSAFDVHTVRSQMGCLVGICDRRGFGEWSETPISIIDWCSRSQHRVTVSTFAAETSAACIGHGMGAYARAIIGEILCPGAHPSEICDDQMPMIQITDCKSLYDHIKADARVPDCRKTAIHLASLKSDVSAGVDRCETKSELRWVPSRWQLADVFTKKGLSKRAREILSEGITRFHEISNQERKRRRAEASKKHVAASESTLSKVDG
eukprot:6429327-Amphidinium_carterae.1